MTVRRPYALANRTGRTALGLALAVSRVFPLGQATANRRWCLETADLPHFVRGNRGLSLVETQHRPGLSGI